MNHHIAVNQPSAIGRPEPVAWRVACPDCSRGIDPGEECCPACARVRRIEALVAAMAETLQEVCMALGLRDG